MFREELRLALIKKDIEIAKLKKVPLASRYGRHGIRWSKQIDYTIILELNSQYPVKTLCEIMNIKRDGFIHSASTPGNPTENGAMESINGWTKEELLRDFMIKQGENIKDAIENYIYYFNNERPASALNYLTPMQYKKLFCEKSRFLPAKINDFCTT